MLLLVTVEDKVVIWLASAVSAVALVEASANMPATRSEASWAIRALTEPAVEDGADIKSILEFKVEYNSDSVICPLSTAKA